jgi:hypothetical protein
MHQNTRGAYSGVQLMKCDFMSSNNDGNWPIDIRIGGALL